MPDTITTAVPQQTPPQDAILHPAQVYFLSRRLPGIVHLVQYDQSLPYLAVELYEGDEPYAVPEGAAVNVRMAKPVPSTKKVYNPAYGISSDRHTVYIQVTPQMTVVAGCTNPVIEVVVDGGIACTGTLRLEIDPNPVQESDLIDTDEYETIQQLASQAQAAAEAAAASQTAAASSASTAASRASAAATSASNASTSATNAAGSASAAAGSASAAAGSASNAAESENAAASSASAAATSASAAQQAAANAQPVTALQVTIPTSAWTSSGSEYRATVTASGVTSATQIVNTAPYASSSTNMAAAAAANAVWTYVETAAGQLIFHAEAKPTAQIQMTVWIKADES